MTITILDLIQSLPGLNTEQRAVIHSVLKESCLTIATFEDSSNEELRGIGIPLGAVHGLRRAIKSHCREKSAAVGMGGSASSLTHTPISSPLQVVAVSPSRPRSSLSQEPPQTPVSTSPSVYNFDILTSLQRVKRYIICSEFSARHTIICWINNALFRCHGFDARRSPGGGRASEYAVCRRRAPDQPHRRRSADRGQFIAREM